MSWTDATDYLKDYRDQRAEALDNQERQRWSTHEVDTIGELVEKFSSSEENSAWERLYTAASGVKFTQKEAVQIKIHFLAGCRRDIRMQFACGMPDRVRNALDHDRFEYMRLAFANMKMAVLKKIVKGKEDGGETV
jgi:hypothetical protein